MFSIINNLDVGVLTCRCTDLQVFINFVKDQNEQYEVQLASLAEQELSSDNDDEAATPESRNGFGVKTVNCEVS